MVGTNLGDKSVESVCGTINTVPYNESRIEVHCQKPLAGRYVTLQQNRKVKLILCEVEVMGYSGKNLYCISLCLFT